MLNGTYTTADGLVNNCIWGIAIDNAGNKWFGTDGNGVSEFDDTTWITYTTTDGLAENTAPKAAVLPLNDPQNLIS